MSVSTMSVAAHLRQRFEQACVLYRSGQLARARPIYEEILRLEPAHAGALYHLGLIAARTGRQRAAAALFGAAGRADPWNAKAYYCEGLALHGAGELGPALSAYEQAVAVNPDYAEGYFGLANVLRDLGRLPEAVTRYERAISIKQDYAEAYCNRGIALRDLHRLDEARTSLHQAVAIRADFAAAYLNLGNVLNELQEWQPAMASYNRAIAIRSDYAEAYCNRAFAWLLHGHFEDGWCDQEWRWRSPNSSNFRDPRIWGSPLWLGKEAVEGRTVLLHSEQGLGDTLQFCRYAQHVAERGAKVVLEVQPPLVSVLTSLPGVSELVAKGAPLPPFDCHCPLMSLPLAFQTDLDSIPWGGPYLHSDAVKVSAWRALLGERTRPRVGLVWSGSAAKRNDRHRSLRLAQLAPYLPSGLTYVSLQKEVRDGDQAALRANPAILDVSTRLRDFSDTAALCECLDVVLSVDTSVAHLNAALGKQTWILLPATPDWRWLLDRSDSPWYPTATLYRQAKPGDWQEVLRRVAADLVEVLAADAVV